MPLLRSEIPTGMCVKLRTVAASNNRDHAPRIYIFLFFTHIPFVVNHTFNATPPQRLQHHNAWQNFPITIFEYLNAKLFKFCVGQNNLFFAAEIFPALYCICAAPPCFLILNQSVSRHSVSFLCFC